MYELELILSEEKGRKLLGVETTLLLLYQATISFKKVKKRLESVKNIREQLCIKKQIIYK